LPQGDPLTYFVDAERSLEAGITELARLGAPSDATRELQGLADTLRGIVQALGKGQYATGDQEPPAPRNIEDAVGALQGDMIAGQPAP
jgi:hypothetical protein